MFKINVVASCSRVETRLSGVLSVDEVKAYHEAVQRLFVSGSLVPGYRMLIDVSECVIQPQDVIAALIEHVAQTPKASRLATVTRDSVIRLQVRRVMRQPYMKIFEQRADALKWLNEVDAPRAGASSALNSPPAA